MSRRKPITVLSISALCLCILMVGLVLVVASGEDTLARIEREINGQGYCLVSESPPVRFQAQSARMEYGSLVLHGSSDPGKEPCVLVTLFPEMGSAGICSAKRVSIERAPGRYERLKLTFHGPTYRPRSMHGRSYYISLRRMSWISRLKWDTRDRIRYMLRQRQKQQNTSP